MATTKSRVLVAVTGAQGVGKSTFATGLATMCRQQLCLDTALFTNVTAEVVAAGVPLGANATPRTIRAFADAHVRRQRSANAPINIFDRCMLDTLAYAVVCGQLNEEALSNLRQETADSLVAMDLVFYLGIAEPYRVLTDLDEDLNMRTRIDTAIRESAEQLSILLRRLDARDPDHIAAGFRNIADCLATKGLC